MRDAPHFGFSLLIRRIRSRRPRFDLGAPCPLARFPAPERPKSRRAAIAKWSPAEPPVLPRAGSARAGSSRPAARGHCRRAEDATALASSRSERTKLNWDKMKRLIDDFLPKPRILNPWPNKRFAVSHPR